MSRSEKLQIALFGLALLLIGAGNQLARSGLTILAVALIGMGILSGGYQLLAVAKQPAGNPEEELTVSQKVVITLRGLTQVGFGLALILGSIAGALRGAEGLWQVLSSQRALLFLAVGAVLAAKSVQVALAEGHTLDSGWELLASIPFRLASLPILLIGLAFLAVGTLALLLPDLFDSWIQTTFGKLITAR
jgi:hypothetical protein